MGVHKAMVNVKELIEKLEVYSLCQAFGVVTVPEAEVRDIIGVLKKYSDQEERELFDRSQWC